MVDKQQRVCKNSNLFDSNSIFETLDSASDFFEKGAAGYSPNRHKYEGLKLHAYTWQVRPLEVQTVHSSFYENEVIFPKGSIQFAGKKSQILSPL